MFKKIKSFFYRMLACVMICFTLTFTIVGDYIGWQVITVQATGVVSYEILMILIELVLGAMGLSMSSETDLSNCAQGLLSVIKNYNDFMYEEKQVCYELQIALATWVTTGTLNLSKECYDWLQNYLYNQVSGTMSSACDVSSPFAEELPVSTVRMKFSEDMWNDVLYGHDVYSDKYSCTYSSAYSKVGNIYDSPLIVTQLSQSGEFKIMTFKPNSTSYAGGLVLLKDDNLSDVNSNYLKCYVYGFSTGSKMYRSTMEFSYDFTRECFLVSSSNYTSGDYNDDEGRYNRYWRFWTFESEGYYYIPVEFKNAEYITKVYINENTRVYSSMEEIAMYAFTSIYAPSSKVYGLSSTAKPYDTNEDDNTVSIPYTSLGITKQVADAVSSALAANPSITDAELNATASDVIAGIQGTTDAVNQNTKTLSTLLTSILSAITAFKFVTATEISQAFVTTFPWMRTIEDVFGDIYDGMLDIPQAFVTTFPWMDTIGGVVGDIYDGILDIPQALVTVFPWADTLDDLIIGLPKGIADALSDELSISIPDVATKDYTDVLDGIAGTLANVFVVDTDAIAVAVGALADVWADKLPVNQFVSLYDGISFSDNYSYPVIKIKRFDIFADFYDEEYVVLIDFAEYAEYMLWCRNLVKALFWFGFGLSLFKHLKTDFHVG